MGCLHVEFLVGLKRTWDQKLSSGLMLVVLENKPCKNEAYFCRFSSHEKVVLLHLPALGTVLTVFAQEQQFMLLSTFKA